MNESVVAMIDKLHARLDDLAEVVKEIPFELNDYDKRLDKIDDQVYLIEVELEKKLKSAVPLSQVSDAQSDAFDEAAGKPQRAGDAESGADAADELRDDAPKSEKAASEDQKDSASSAKEEEPKEEGFLTDSAKETIAGATKKLNSFYKEGKEVVGEFSEAFDDIKEAFGKNPFKKR